MISTSPFQRANEYLLGTIGEAVSPRTSYKLDRMRALLSELGDPHLAYPTVHIGGTSGKGSTSTMIATVLQTSGKRIGLHTKPHLRSAIERARIDGIAIPEDRFASLLFSMMPSIERVTGLHGRPTYYETLLALAFVYFASERVDVAVVEVGLGGRLDGTNVVEPVSTAITSVGYDHTDVLGETLTSIAREKAGIAKRGVPFIIAPVDPEAAAVLEETAAQAGAPIVRVADAVRIDATIASSEPYAQRCIAHTARGHYRFDLPLHGSFQRSNAATAIVVLETLPDALRPNRESIERGMERVSIPARMEVFGSEPTVVLDIAHNAEKAAGLAASLREEFPGRRIACVIAIGQSKNAADIVRALAAVSSEFTCTSFDVPGRHATAPQQLSAIASGLGCTARAVADPIDAFERARREAGRDDVVLVTGSTFVAADVRHWLANAER